MKKVLLIPWIIALMLFCDTYIDALTITSEVEKTGDGYFTAMYPQDYTEQGDWYYKTMYGGNTTLYYISSTNIPVYLHDYIEISFMVGNYATTGNNAILMDQCNQWQLSNGIYYCIDSEAQQGTISNNNNANFNGYGIYANAQFVDSNGNYTGWNSCTIEGNKIICPLQHTNYLSAININTINTTNDSTFFRLYINRGYNFYSRSNITGAINNQTQQQQQQYQEATNGTWTPNNNVNTNQNGANETIEWGQQEEALLNSLDMNTTIMSDITIDPTASAFIWDIAGGLRNMNPAIIMVMTSILGLGIVKMILNR